MGEVKAQPRWRAAFTVLTHRNFLVLWLAQGLMMLSVNTLGIALTDYIYAQTGTASGVSILFFANFFSMVVGPPIAGMLADRYNRKHVIISITIIRALLVLLFLFARASSLVYVLNFALAVVATFFIPVRGALLPVILKKNQLLDANAMVMSISTLAMIVGPLLGGFLVTQYSAQTVFLFCGIFLLAAALITLLMQLPTAPVVPCGQVSPRAILMEFVDGLRAVRENPTAFFITTIYAVYLIGIGLRAGLDVVFAEKVLSGPNLTSAMAYSIIGATTSIGLFVGSQLIRYLARFVSKKQLLLISLGLMNLDALAFTFARGLPFVLGIRFIRGLGGGISDSLWMTLLQENVEEQKCGRVISFTVAAASLPSSLSVYLGGWFADRTSIHLIYGIAGVWTLLTVLAGPLLSSYRAIPVRYPHKTIDSSSTSVS